MKKNSLNSLVKSIQKYVLSEVIKAGYSKQRYHSAEHAKELVEYTEMLARHYQLDENDFTVAVSASWFHNLGYLRLIEDPVSESAMLAERFLIKMEVSAAMITAICNCILTTRPPQKPITLVERIVCDSQFFYLGTEDFVKQNKLLRKEWMLLNNRKITKMEWSKNTVSLMEQHIYHTDYGQAELDTLKMQNLWELELKISGEKPDQFPLYESHSSSIKGTIKDKQPKAYHANRKPEKGIETMFRISSGNHQRLSDLADKKAHIMITVNSIILSAIISLVLRKLETYSFLVIPTFILLLVSISAMTFSILSTRPTVPQGTFKQEDLDHKKVNLLFFGNFYKMQLEQFTVGMEMMMDDGAFLYGSLIRDVYAQGVILGKKYHLLRISYSIFMYGAISAVAAFMLAYIFKT